MRKELVLEDSAGLNTANGGQQQTVEKAQYRYAVEGSDTTMLNSSTEAGYQKELRIEN